MIEIKYNENVLLKENILKILEERKGKVSYPFYYYIKGSRIEYMTDLKFSLDCIDDKAGNYILRLYKDTVVEIPFNNSKNDKIIDIDNYQIFLFQAIFVFDKNKEVKGD